MSQRRKSQPALPPTDPSIAIEPLKMDAFADLYDRFADRVHAYALQRLRDPELAADVTSIVFTRALASVHSFKNPEPGTTSANALEGWLLTIARNAIIDHVRADQRVTILDAATYREHISDHSQDPANAAVAPDECEQLLNALEQINTTQQRIVMLRLQGWNGTEIADLLGMPHGAVRVAQHRAYARLRELLTVEFATPSALIPEPNHA